MLFDVLCSVLSHKLTIGVLCVLKSHKVDAQTSPSGKPVSFILKGNSTVL